MLSNLFPFAAVRHGVALAAIALGLAVDLARRLVFDAHARRA